MSEVKNELDIFADLTLAELSAHFFLHPSTLRLTDVGYKHLRTVFSAYTFDIDKTTLRPKHLIILANAMEYPYHITKNQLILFSDRDATMVKLCGSIEQFLETYM